MSITRSIALGSLLLVSSGCASAPGDTGSREVAKKPIRGGVAELTDITYDGRILKARVLLGATVDSFSIDGRMFENLNVELEDLRACGKKEPLKHWVMEALHQPPEANEIVTINRGYWYGANLEFFLFDEKTTGLGPDCFEADLVAHARGRRVAATLPLRVVRTDKPPAPTEGATAEPKPPPADAATP